MTMIAITILTTTVTVDIPLSIGQYDILFVIICHHHQQQMICTVHGTRLSGHLIHTSSCSKPKLYYKRKSPFYDVPW